MKQIKVALIDLNHMTMGLHTNTVPLGIGAISRHLSLAKGEAVDIKMFKDSHRFLETLKDWQPDVLGMAQYCWNSELNFYVAGQVRRVNPACLIVLGGPDQPISFEERQIFLKQRKEIDICVSYDGEITFTLIVERLLKGAERIDLRDNPVAGTYALNSSSRRLIESSEEPPRLDSLDGFGPMYAAGWFKGFLDDGFHPFVQTHRGCPFKCAYCHTANDYCSRVIFQSAEYFKQDMIYLGRRYAGQHNVNLYMANANLSLFKEDFEIARVIRSIQDEYDWPKNIVVNCGKNPDRLLEFISILKYKFIPYISLQTLTPEVLKNISRTNIPFNTFIDFQRKVTATITKNTTTELILSMPGETKKSFLNTLRQVLNSGVQKIVIYTLIALKGTVISSRKYAEQFGHIIRHRLIPRCFSQINGARIFETEEVVVGTGAMPFDDYMDLRGLTLIVTIFANSAEMFPIRKFLLECGLEVNDWVFAIHQQIADFPNLDADYRSFLKETDGELFVTRDGLVKFFSDDKHYQMLCSGKLGDNLLRKYKTLFLTRHFESCLKAAFASLRRIGGERLSDLDLDTLIADLDTYLMTRNIGNIFTKDYQDISFPDTILAYDIPSWLSDKEGGLPLKEHRGSFPYSVIVSDYARERLKGFMELKRDLSLSMQILYRDGYTRDLWPSWVPKGSKVSSDR